jgi:hypothetical protein
MVAVLQWRYASQKMLRAIRVVLARIRQPLVWHQSLAVMHVHQARNRAGLAKIVLVTAQIALPTRTKTKEGKARVKNALVGRPILELRFVLSVQLASISTALLVLIVQQDIPASMDKHRALYAWEANIPT